MKLEELYSIITSDESYRIEKTMSTNNMDKFQEAICAFANDLPGGRKKGYLLIGVNDEGKIGGLKVDDALMKRISGIRSDGNILPLPVMNTEKVETEQGDVLVVEVTPSFDTPVRYRGRTFVRIGPRRDIASAEEERILSERCAASLPTFDTHPCREARLDDLDTDVIINDYLPKAIDAEVLEKDLRPLKEQLASLHLFNVQWDCPTYAALILFGRNPKYFMPGAYIQFVRFKGHDNGGEILNERRFEGCLYRMLPQLENFIRDGVITKRPIPVSILKEKNIYNYPYKALRELLMNAVMHRDYQSNMPTRFYQYDNHIEVMNPGGLYGQARPENFPYVNDYRNSVVAEVMRNLNYVNMFNHGVQEVQALLRENQNPAAKFNVNYLTAFSVIVKDEGTASLPKSAQVSDSIQSIEDEEYISLAAQRISKSCPSLAQVLPKHLKVLCLLCKQECSLLEMMNVASATSRRSFVRSFVKPMVKAGLLAMTHPENPRFPFQKYHLTEQGKQILNQNTDNNIES